MAEETMTTPLTAVIPVSNYQIHAQNIEIILRSVAAFGIEVILVLDSQPKQAFDELVQIFADLKLNGRVIQENFNNPGSSRNSGLALANREWVAFWDCDDFPLIEETVKLIEEAEFAKTRIAVGSYEVEDLQTHNVLIQELNLRSPLIGIGLNPGIWRMIFNNEVLDGIEFPHLSMGEDQVFLQRVINQETKIIFRNYPVYRYRVGVSSQLTSDFNKVRDIVPAHELAVTEYEPRVELNIIGLTMLVRQELTILKYPGLRMTGKFHLCQSLLKKLSKHPQILIQLIISKFRNPQDKRAQ